MSFRKYGGMNYAATHNIVKSNVNTADSLYVTNNVGQKNSYINFDSDIDCSGNLTVDGSLNVLGYANFENDILVNSLTVGKGGGNTITNTVVGYQALQSNTAGGVHNTSVGYQALLTNSTGINNTSVGVSALKSNSTGKNNTATGYNALYYNTGNNNTSVGVSALVTNSTGINNTSVGFDALFTNSIGANNTGIGGYSLSYNIDGSNNTAIGYFAGAAGDASHNSWCTFLGYNTGNSAAAGSNISLNKSTAIGYNSEIDCSNQIVLGTPTEGVYLPGNYLKIGTPYTSKGYNGFALDVDGSANFTNGINATVFYQTSDYRIKENVIPLDFAFTVDNLNPVTYTNTKTQKQDIGLIAHELQEHYPFLVNGTKDGEELQSVNYTGLIGILTKEIQSLKKEVSLMNLQIAQLQNK